jgi:hypothetical protein
MQFYKSFNYKGNTYHLKRLGGLEYFQSFHSDGKSNINMGNVYISLIQSSVVNDRGEKSFTLDQTKNLPIKVYQILSEEILYEHRDIVDKYKDIDNIQSQSVKDLGLYQISLKTGIDIDEVRGWPLDKQMGWKFALQELNRLEEEEYKKARGESTTPSKPHPLQTSNPHSPTTQQPAATRKFVIGADGDMHVQSD